MPLPPAFQALAKKVNNWGRWGPEDERGTLNLITDEVVRRAASSIRTGTAFPLAIPLSEDGPMLGNIPPGRQNPERKMFELHDPFTKSPDSARVNSDVFTLHLQSATHWDAIEHVEYAGRLYNGVSPDSVTETGAAKLGIDTMGPLITRGLLLDIARLKGVDRLPVGTLITPDDLDAAVKLADVTVESGDAILVRTGAMRWLKEGDKESYAGLRGGIAGLGIESAAWFHSHDVSAVATDTPGFEVWPRESEDLLRQLGHPLHLLCLVEMGMPQGQNFDLEDLAEACAADGRYDIFLSATPEPFARGLGGPVAPVAIR
jgi:kynurenine formamidase